MEGWMFYDDVTNDEINKYYGEPTKLQKSISHYEDCGWSPKEAENLAKYGNPQGYHDD